MECKPINFAQPIPLFPLPNCVLFPGVVQPLHIFEPRYKQMMCHALKTQSALAMALLKPGWEKNYHGTPDIHELVCVGRIVTQEKLDDGKYNLLLHGLTRATILSQQKAGDPEKGLFRVATLDPVPDANHPPNPDDARLQRKLLVELFEKTSLKHLTIAPSLHTLFDSHVPHPRLIDVLCFTLIQDVAAKQKLLETLDPLARGKILLNELLTLTRQLDSQPAAMETAAPAATWPPPLSTN